MEYLFFRNFYPNLEKLQPKLVKAPGACQSHVCEYAQFQPQPCRRREIANRARIAIFRAHASFFLEV